MDTLLIITILIVFFALAFDFINGFHDTANAIATAVSTKALKPRHAIIMAAVMNFVGAMTFTGVAKTITKDIASVHASEWFICNNGCSTCRYHMEPSNVVLRNTKQFLPCIDWFDCWCSHCCSRIRWN